MCFYIKKTGQYIKRRARWEYNAVHAAVSLYMIIIAAHNL